MLLSFLVRGNYLAAVVGTLVGNPWTFPVIWLDDLPARPLHARQRALGDRRRSSEPELTSRWHDAHERLIWPMTVGGVPLGALAGLLIYLPVVRMVAAYQNARRRRRERRQAERRDRLGMADSERLAGYRRQLIAALVSAARCAYIAGARRAAFRTRSP